MMQILTHIAAVGAMFAVSFKWLRVSQREHYISGYSTRFALRWWFSRPINVAALALVVVCIVAAIASPAAAIAAALLLVVFPLGLTFRGRTSKLAWTGRLKRLGVVVWVDMVILAVGFWFTPYSSTLVLIAAIAAPALVDSAALLMAGFEKTASRRFVNEAQAKLEQVRPRVIAVTGSYGKTTTKNYIAHLLASTQQVVASPASFNNMLGLARTVNEHLTPGTDVLVAEMGDYGPGEIAAMCSWTKPEVGVITAVGFEHFERFGSMEAIARSKSEVLEGVRVAVVNVDSPFLPEMAERLTGSEVITCSSLRDAIVTVRPEGDRLAIEVRGRPVATIERLNRHPSNVACAIGAALAMDVPADSLAGLLDGLESPEHRATVEVGASGIKIIDDTYNSNPVGAEAALELLDREGATGARIVVTPGMVEMGVEQANLNRIFAEHAAGVADTVVVVGRTNRRALLAGVGEACNVVEVGTRDEATRWIRENFGAGDIVLYENDLPDHFP